MTGEMPNKTTTTKAGAKGATKVARNRTARRAAKPAAKATWFVGKRVAKRKARNTPAATATLPARRGPQRSSTGRWSRRCSEGSSNPSPGAGSRPSWPGSRSVAASCTSRSATGRLGPARETDTTPPRARRHLRLAVLTARVRTIPLVDEDFAMHAIATSQRGGPLPRRRPARPGDCPACPMSNIAHNDAARMPKSGTKRRLRPPPTRHHRALRCHGTRLAPTVNST